MAIILKSAKVNDYTITLMADPKHKPNKNGEINLVYRFNFLKDRYYMASGVVYDVKKFEKVCALSDKTKNGELLEEKKALVSKFDEMKAYLDNLGKWQSIDFIKNELEKKDNRKKVNSFLEVWRNVIDNLNEEGRFTTAESYECAYKSFVKILGGNNIKGFNINLDVLKRWCDGMEHGIIKDGLLVGQISETTKGIYLRNCRAIWNECSRLGLLGNDYPFSNVEKKKLISIPSGAERKDEYLDRQKMTQLYNIFTEKQYPEKWNPNYKKMVHYSLGLFLVQYLGNGMNLADVALLKYDNFYYSRDGQAFRFYRRKTERRSKGNSEVIVPIVEPLRKVLEGIADCNDEKSTYINAPKMNAFVFPNILKGETTPEGIRKQTKQENSNVAKRVQKVCKEVLGWVLKPSGTWCRHSFATNLAHAGIEEKYIKECMGHSVGKDVTSLYIDKYPIEIQMENNNKLLNLSAPDKIDVDSLVNNLTPEQKKELIEKLLGK